LALAISVNELALIAFTHYLSTKNTMKLTIEEQKKARSSSVSSLAKPLLSGIDRQTKNPRLLAQWQSIEGKLHCQWFLG
jgi:hypothetical protein